jgi:phosphoglycolate phosphatase-like HAD superfamily hydrolase
MPNSTLPQRPVALLLDFDGVILQSVDIKESAYAAVYAAESEEKRTQMLAYQRQHGGVTRRVKFRYFEQALFGRSGDAASVERLSEAFTRHVFDAVVACPFVPGADRFLQFAQGRTDLHVISGTPQDELDDIVRRRDLARYFKSVHGAPATKRDTFATILASNTYAAHRTLAVGDAPTEFHAATDLGIPFLGVVPVGAASPFPADVPVVPTLETLDALLGFDRAPAH